jgi:hypothetical protein
MPKPLFGWRSAIASENGPENSTTRHVLLTISLHMGERGNSAFPSLSTIATESGLSKSTVCRHVKKAIENGWLEKNGRLRKSGADSSNLYSPSVPSDYEHDEGQQFEAQGGVAENNTGGCREQHGGVAEDNPNANTTITNTTPNGTSPSSNDSGDGATHPRTQGGTDDQTPDPPTVQWQSPDQLFDNDTTLPTTTGDGAPPQALDVPQSPQEIREWVGGTDTGSMGWRVGEIFRGLFCPWLTDDELRKEYLGRLLSEANRMVGEATYDGSPMDKPRSRIELAVALVHLYQERDDLHGREDSGARKDQPTAVLNVLADQITRKVKDDEQQQGHDRRPDDPLHQLVAEAEQAHA